AYEMAKDLIDLRITQIEENLEYRKQQLKERRRAKREIAKNAESENGETNVSQDDANIGDADGDVL
ncbi:MAG: hypothetical protein HFK07_04435, partial [Clostridia bacterium]|nr:hypothetical protein [Clostridia bacterium]